MFRRSRRRAAARRRREADLRRGREARPRAAEGERQCRRGARAAAQGDRALREAARERALRRERAGRRSSTPSATKLERYRRELDAIGGVSWHRRWLESLSPWPVDGFGHRADAARCSSGSATRSAASTRARRRHERQVDRGAARSRARSAGLRYTSPHVAGWHERLDTDPDGLRARGRARPRRRRGGRRDAVRGRDRRRVRRLRGRGVDVAAIEAGLGGRHDATNVIDAPRRPAHERRARAHRACSARRARRSPREKLAVGGARRRRRPAGRASSRRSCPRERGADRRRARAAAEAFLGATVELAEASLPGRLELARATARCATARTPRRRSTGCSSGSRARRLRGRRLDPRDKDADGILARLAARGPTLVATSSSNAARAARRGGRRARPPAPSTRVETANPIRMPRSALAQRLGGARARHRLALPACRLSADE